MKNTNLKQVILKHRVLLLKIAIHLLLFLPLLAIYLLAISDQLGGDPVKEVIHFTGVGAFNILLISLVLTPLAKKYQQGYLLQVRRLLGLYSFTYAMCHLLNFIAFELQFNIALFVDEVIKRPYITVGMAALLILFALAITSISSLKRKMGKNWQRLHNGVYVVALLTALHFFWSVKSDIIEPSVYVAMTLFLLSFRYHKIKRWLAP